MKYEYEVRYSFDAETGQIIAEIPELSLADSGHTFDEAEKNIMDALKTYLEYLIESGSAIPEPSQKEGTLLKVAV